MDNNGLIASLQQEMQQASGDIKAEAQLLLALEHGLAPDHFMVNCNSRFRREYSRDLVSSELKDEGPDKNILHIHLSRSGIYDQLPEGLFFQASGKAGAQTVAGMAADYKHNKKREEEIRRFFLPFENDFFLQRLSAEEQETLLLEGLQSGIINDYFIRFWDLPLSIPKPMLAPLVLLLPHACKIAGDTGLTAQSLQQVLQEPVAIKLQRTAIADGSISHPPALGEAQLGLDLVCGETFWEESPVMEITIGPLQQSAVSEYLEGGDRCTLLETFNRFFIPAGVDTAVTVLVPAGRRHMTLAKHEPPVLGYSSFL